MPPRKGGRFWVTYFVADGGRWVKFPRNERRPVFDPRAAVGTAAAYWGDLDQAQKALNELAQRYPLLPLRVEERDNNDDIVVIHFVVNTNVILTEGVTDMNASPIGHVEQPLLIPRETVIKALQGRIQEREDAHAAKIAKEKEKAQKLVDFLNVLIEKDVAAVARAFTRNAFDPNGYETQEEAVEQFLKYNGSDKLEKEQQLVPDANLERLVRTLEMATATDNIEVKPSDPVYALL